MPRRNSNFMRNLILKSIACLAALTTLASGAGVPAEKDLAAYLLVYFKDDTHSLYFALSSDGYSFTDVNKGAPIIKGEDIAEQKGVRDPYLMRGPDNNFYMAMTDLHIFAKQQGIRTSEWERDGAKYGWGNNKAMVLMKSSDLINWSHRSLHVDTAFPGLEDIGCAWAPEMNWDEQKKQMMIHFTMRYGNGRNQIYYSYLDKDFTKLATKPELLFDYPGDKSYIDGDITKVGNDFHLFYCSHDGTPGIKQAVSTSLNSGYVLDPKYYDFEKNSCEAPMVWKRIGQEKWVVMYDCYGIKPHNFGFMETTDFKNFTNIGHFNDGVMKTTNFSSPKHGAVVLLTAAEAKKLADHWKLEKY
jgi:hypothetical protein